MLLAFPSQPKKTCLGFNLTARSRHLRTNKKTTFGAHHMLLYFAMTMQVGCFHSTPVAISAPHAQPIVWFLFLNDDLE